MKTYYLIILLLAASYLEAQAINKVKIVTIGGGFNSTYVGANRDDRNIGGFGTINIDDVRNQPQKIVDRTIEYWKRELNKALHHKPDLVVVTEFCDEPIGLNKQEYSDYLAVRKNQIHDFFASVAKANRCYIAFGTQRDDNGVWRNSMVVLDRKGNVAGIYNKNYPTIGELTGYGIKACDKTPLIQCDFGTIVGALCFDLNFDELRDRNAALKPDILLFLTQWHAGLEQSKWAYTCRSFFVCSYAFPTFPSEIRNPFGDVVAASSHIYRYAVATVNLDRQMLHMSSNLEKVKALKTKYGNKAIVTEKRDGIIMITSEHEQISAADMVKEFGIELLDDYQERARQTRLQKLKAN